MRKIEKRSDCPISYSLDLLGDKWTFLILRDMALNGKHFYKDFLHAGEGMATNVLSDRLKMLETYGIIGSRQYDKVRTMKYYSLTEKGRDLIPILIELWVWGARYDPRSAVSKEELERRIQNKDKLMKQYVDAVQVND